MALKEEIKWLEMQLKTGNDHLVLSAIIKRLKSKDKIETPSAFHGEAIGYYKNWLASYKLPAFVDAREAKALKEILLKLKNASKDKTEEAAYLSFQAILQHWPRVGHYLEKRKQLTTINQNLLEIIDKIKNGATKQATRNLEAHAFDEEIKREHSLNNGSNG